MVQGARGPGGLKVIKEFKVRFWINRSTGPQGNQVFKALKAYGVDQREQASVKVLGPLVLKVIKAFKVIQGVQVHRSGATGGWTSRC